MNAAAEADDDRSPAIARRCACGEPVIDAEQISREPILIDAREASGGQWFPFKVREGKVTVGPWRPALDGITPVRLRTHKCAVKETHN